MNDIQPGDTVVCINDDPIYSLSYFIIRGNIPKLNRKYKVRGISYGGLQFFNSKVFDKNRPEIEIGWNRLRFKKI